MALRKFVHSTSGQFATIFAMCVPAVLGAAGFSVDIANIMRAKTHLQDSLDAAALAASHLGDTADSRVPTFNRYFDSEVAAHKELFNIERTLTVDEQVNSIKTTAVASADVKLFFPVLFGALAHVSATAGSTESNTNIEVVLVLDNTGSMVSNNSTKMANLRKATTNLLTMLQVEQAKNPTRSIKAALVPFVTAVNVAGEEFSDSWIDKTGGSKYNGLNFPSLDGKTRPNNWQMFQQLVKTNANVAGGTGLPGGWDKTGWKGCVEARPGSLNISDDPPDPSNPDTLFVPYFAPDDPPYIDPSEATVATKVSSSYGNSSSTYNNSYLTDAIDASQRAKLQSQPGLNILGIDVLGLLNQILGGLLGGPTKHQVDSLAKYIVPKSMVVSESGSSVVQSDGSYRTIGPNRACPTPIVPLTTDLGKLITAANAMQAWGGSGTNVSEGLAWGMRVLSPQAPYTDGVPWNTTGTTKIVLLLTDGTNEVYGASNTVAKSDYTSYGYLANGRMGTTDHNQAVAQVNNWVSDVCTQLKKQDAELYTITLQSDTSANRTLYGNCANKQSDYYAVNDPDQLTNVFQNIASKFLKLQLTN